MAGPQPAPPPPDAGSVAPYSYSAPPADGPPARRPRALWAGALAAVVVVVLLVVVLVGSGIWPLGSRSGSSEPGTYSRSVGPAQSTADAAPGGPWTLYIAVGVASPAAVSESIANASAVTSSFGTSPCAYTPSAGTTSTLATPSVGNVSSGVASAWVFFFSNVTGGVLLVSVIAGTAAVDGTLSGSGCSLTSAGLSPLDAPDLIDSTAASADAGAAGGWDFLAAHPDANATLVLVGGLTQGGASYGPLWLVGYDACPQSEPGPATAPIFLALISATDGSVIESQTTTATCPSASGPSGPHTTPLSSALGFGSPGEAVRGSEYWYNFSVQLADGTVTWANTSLSVDSNGLPLSLPSATATVLSLTGTGLASFDLGTGQWSGASPQSISSQETLSLECSTSLSGDTLVLQGLGAYSGSLAVGIP